MVGVAETTGGVIQLREDLLKNMVRGLMAYGPGMLRAVTANTMFVLLVAKELVLPSSPEG